MGSEALCSEMVAHNSQDTFIPHTAQKQRWERALLGDKVWRQIYCGVFKEGSFISKKKTQNKWSFGLLCTFLSESATGLLPPDFGRSLHEGESYSREPQSSAQASSSQMVKTITV